ncbi:poly [ADP-ribose] polymerase 11 isoform X4 [Cynoglossus semilaevis]|uniref:poly [ADP-ribose] polymerase 11 isoform X4 n=1 Tax=Cynoglossus semilaevis TaxID=244447 RepID=UPI000D62C782|nr:poly [ADP-ribose] polymerase 11 isoform X4 [Cynoglossus semilaevis]
MGAARGRLNPDLAMLAIRSSEEETAEIMEDMDTSDPDWSWFYLAECGVWHMFEIDPSAACSVTCAQIEQCYNRNQRGVMEFRTAKYTYRLDFSVMRQINVTTGKQRPIKRSLHSATGFRKKTQLRKVKRMMDIEERMLFHGTGHSNIQAICTFNFDWRLTGSHGDLYGKGRKHVNCCCFVLLKTTVPASLAFPSLFSGSYFARDAIYSSKFCHTTGKHNNTLQRHGLAPPIFASDPPYKTMFLARVLVGEYTQGQSMYCRPPSKDASFTNFYDSCVDDIANPKIYVIFDSNQIYPEYLIEFY